MLIEHAPKKIKAYHPHNKSAEKYKWDSVPTELYIVMFLFNVKQALIVHMFNVPV